MIPDGLLLRAPWGCGEEKQIPFGNDTQKSNNGNDKLWVLARGFR
jgi:hypothetical protein